MYSQNPLNSRYEIFPARHQEPRAHIATNTSTCLSVIFRVKPTQVSPGQSSHPFTKSTSVVCMYFCKSFITWNFNHVRFYESNRIIRHQERLDVICKEDDHCTRDSGFYKEQPFNPCESGTSELVNRMVREHFWGGVLPVLGLPIPDLSTSCLPTPTSK